MRSAWLLLPVSLFVGCGPYKPGPDAGVTDAASNVAPDAAKEAGPCVDDYQSCTAASTCCATGYTCNSLTGVCQPPCTPINGLCSDNAYCCSGICNGTCQ